METKKYCLSCKGEIDTSAKKCKYCGTDQRNWFVRHPIITGLGGLIVFIIIISSITGNNNPSSVEKTGAEQNVVENKIDFTLTAKDFLKEYEANSVAADTKYEGKILKVSGYVYDIGEDITATTYITINGSGEEFSVNNVQCMFQMDNESAVATISKGQEVVVIGRGAGSGILGGALMRNCKIVE